MQAIQRLSRSEFLDGYFDYGPGEHLSAIEPTGGGKSYFLRQLLAVAHRQNPGLRIAYLMPKPSSPTTAETASVLNYGITPTWPPAPRMPWQPKRDGHIVWPPHQRGDVLANRAQVAAKLRAAMADQYWHGDSITVADDVYVLAVLMGLNPECEEHWTAGREQGAGLWSANQKPSGTVHGSVSTFSYSAPTHLILGHDTDERNLRRFGEIGGVDPERVKGLVRGLRVYRIGDSAVSEKLYIDRRGPYMAVIGL